MSTYQFIALWSLGQAILCHQIGTTWWGALHLVMAYMGFALVALSWWVEWSSEREIIRRVVEIEMEKAGK